MRMRCENGVHAVESILYHPECGILQRKFRRNRAAQKSTYKRLRELNLLQKTAWNILHMCVRNNFTNRS
jgi:hypothetical protein